MAKKKDNTNKWIIGIGIVVILLLLIYGGNHGWFKSTPMFSVNNSQPASTTIIQRLESTPYSSTCSLSITPTTLTSGDLLTGTITDGANAFCEGYGKMAGTDDWRKVWEGRTDITGKAIYSDNLVITGDFTFAVICDTSGNGIIDATDCVTNMINVNVNPLPNIKSCVDSDGKNKMTPGHVTTESGYYYDECTGNWAVKEYYCNGNDLAEQIISCDAGYICYTTRSGGYCKATANPSCGDTYPSCNGDCPTGQICNQLLNHCVCITATPPNF